MFVRIPHNTSNTGQRSDFFRSTLSVASSNDDFGVWILASHAPNRGARILVGSGGDCTRVQNNHVGLRCGRGAGQTTFLELAFEGSAIGLGRTATEILDVIAGHGTMVAYAAALRGPTASGA